MNYRHHVGATLIILSLAAFARGDITVYFDFRNSGLCDPCQTAIMQQAHQKYEFIVDGVDVGANLTFVSTPPPPGEGFPHRIVFDNLLLPVLQPYGATYTNRRPPPPYDDRIERNFSIIYRKVVTEGGPSPYYPTEAIQATVMAETAAHELGHQFGLFLHNDRAQNNQFVWIDVGGRLRRRTPGSGNLVNGRPGLMPEGAMVNPDERVADLREFTDVGDGGEKRRIGRAIIKEKGGRRTDPVPGRGPHSSLLPIHGQHFDPQAPLPQPPWTEPFPSAPEDSWVNLTLQITGNGVWDIGWTTADGGFMPMIDAGASQGRLSFGPGTVFNLAIRRVGLSDDMSMGMDTIGSIDFFSDPVPASRSREPVVTDTYYRAWVIRLDPDGSPLTEDVVISLSVGDTDADIFDGLQTCTACVPTGCCWKCVNQQYYCDITTEQECQKNIPERAWVEGGACDNTQPCGPCIPTLSQWGLIIFTLLLFSAGTLLFSRKQLALAAPTGTIDVSLPAGISWLTPATFGKAAAVCGAVAILGCAIALRVYGELALRDAVGGLMTALLGAYVVHLWIELYRRRRA